MVVVTPNGMVKADFGEGLTGIPGGIVVRGLVRNGRLYGSDDVLGVQLLSNTDDLEVDGDVFYAATVVLQTSGGQHTQTKRAMFPAATDETPVDILEFIDAAGAGVVGLPVVSDFMKNLMTSPDGEQLLGQYISDYIDENVDELQGHPLDDMQRDGNELVSYVQGVEVGRFDVSDLVFDEVNYAKPLRNVSSRGNLVDTRSDGVVTSQTSRLRHVIRGGAVMVRLVYANWYLPSGSAEQPMGNSYDIKASIENPSVSGGRPTGDVTIPVFFGGKRTATVENNAHVISDPVLINAPADWAVFVRSLATVTSGGRFPTAYATSTTGVAQLDTSGVAEGFVNNTDSVDSGTISAATGFVFGPVAILVDAINATHTHGALIIGDSIARGTGIVTARGSFLAQACINDGIPIHRLAVGGDSFAYSKSPANVFRRMSLSGFARHALVNMGTNDIWSGSSLATLKADAIAYWKLMADQGMRVHQTTILPRPGASTDGYLTASNQSIITSAYETIRTAFNTWLRSGQAVTDAAGALASVIDSAALIEVDASNALTVNGGRWKAGGPVSVTGTATGVTTTTLTDSTKSWTTNQYQNQVLLIVSATTGAGQIARITSNTATVLSLNPALTLPTGTVTYQVAPANCFDHTHPTETGYALITDGLDLSYLKTT